jgi:hypothetical protein
MDRGCKSPSVNGFTLLAAKTFRISNRDRFVALKRIR